MLWMKKDTEHFTKTLRRVREAKGWTQGELAKKADLQHRHYCRYELGETSPSLTALIRLAKVLNVTIDSLATPEAMNLDGLSDKELFSLFKEIDQMDYGTRLIVKEVLESVIVRKKLEQKKAS